MSLTFGLLVDALFFDDKELISAKVITLASGSLLKSKGSEIFVFGHFVVEWLLHI